MASGFSSALKSNPEVENPELIKFFMRDHVRMYTWVSM
ncbi:MAG: hypothetical protein JWM59_3636 [Verrucomicrobiales bacterium]|nr:hypothetical protein [Verrucomicrobiales bacterium]